MDSAKSIQKPGSRDQPLEKLDGVIVQVVESSPRLNGSICFLVSCSLSLSFSILRRRWFGGAGVGVTGQVLR